MPDIEPLNRDEKISSVSLLPPIAKPFVVGVVTRGECNDGVGIGAAVDVVLLWLIGVVPRVFSVNTSESVDSEESSI